ncbi:MAG: Rrf2 family transcriptional regulator [Candidatus Eremiobacteraeota bacterium]|nr:Rrf2 family transcriptional regulator [Candidatus Eremiobacteraeota bacterium]
MVLRNQVEWALHCCSILAAMPDQEVSTRDLAAFHGVPKEYLSKALQALSRAGLVEGSLGKTGGYRLARKPEAITFLDIVQAVEGKRRSFECSEIRQNNPCLPEDFKVKGVCAVARVMYDADEAWRAHLRSVTLADLGKNLQRDVPVEILADSRQWFVRT